ncbi:hypothetical protein YC2023_017984 [Brassica napus]
MDRVSFSSTLVPLSGIYVVPVRSLMQYAVFLLYLSRFCFSSWWQLEEKLARIFHLVNMVITDIDFPVCLLFGAVCFLNISQSELEAQTLLHHQQRFKTLFFFCFKQRFKTW